MVVRTSLLTIDEFVIPQEGLVFSTQPRRAEGENGVSYFVKGPNVETVFAEVAGCLLAKEVGLLVPDIAVCECNGETYAGSVKVEHNIRDVLPLMEQMQRVVNFDEIFDAVVVDVWLANNDRNIGALVARPHSSKKGCVEFVFLDFEKSVALHPQPLVSATMLEPRALWPGGVLGNITQKVKPLHPPIAMVNRIRSLTAERCGEVVHEVTKAVTGPILWEADSVHALTSRAGRIQELAEEVWAAIS